MKRLSKYIQICMVYNEMVKFRRITIKGDWPGLTFPGGHIEDGEDPNAVKREVKEETGLTISDVEFVDEFVWCTMKRI